MRVGQLCTSYLEVSSSSSSSRELSPSEVSTWGASHKFSSGGVDRIAERLNALAEMMHVLCLLSHSEGGLVGAEVECRRVVIVLVNLRLVLDVLELALATVLKATINVVVDVSIDRVGCSL